MVVFLFIFLLVLEFCLFSSQRELQQDNPFQSLSETLNYTNLPGIQIYFFQNDQNYLFTSLFGDQDGLYGETYLFTNWDYEEIETKGIYAGIELGSDTMENGDYIVLYYLGNDTWDARDSYLGGLYQSEEIVFKKDSEISASSSDDVKISKTNYIIQDLSQNKFPPYRTLIVFQWFKNITSPDQRDWSDIKTWKSNQGYISGAVGLLNPSSLSYHSKNRSPKSLTLYDGAGLPNIKDTNEQIATQTISTGQYIVSNSLKWTMDYSDIHEILNPQAEKHLGIDSQSNLGRLHITHILKNGLLMMTVIQNDSERLVARTYLLLSEDFDVSPHGIYAGISIGEIATGSIVMLEYQGGKDFRAFEALIEKGLNDLRWGDVLVQERDEGRVRLEKAGWFRGLREENWGNVKQMFVFEWEMEIDREDWIGRPCSVFVGLFDREGDRVFPFYVSENGKARFENLSGFPQNGEVKAILEELFYFAYDGFWFFRESIKSCLIIAITLCF